MSIGCLTLWRSERFYGRLLSGYDAQFYYGAARSLVIDHDLDVTNDLEVTAYQTAFDWNGDGQIDHVPRIQSGRIVNKYFVGLSALEVPWLALGTAVRLALSPDDSRPLGYGRIEIWFVAVGLLTYFAVGMQLLYRLLRQTAPVPWALLGVAATWLGTSLFYYSTVFPFMAHPTAFAIVVGLVYLTNDISNRAAVNQRLVLIGILASALFLVRPQQIVLALLIAPKLVREFRSPYRRWLPGAVAGAMTFVAAAAIQLAINTANTGVVTFNTYAVPQVSNWQFEWRLPNLGAVLFAPYYGLIFSSPIVLVAAAGYALTWRRGVPWAAKVFLLHSLVQLYIDAAFWPAGPHLLYFGMRIWTEGAGMVAAGIAQFHLLQRPLRRTSIAGAGLAMSWTTVLMLLFVLKSIAERGNTVVSVASAGADLVRSFVK